jgi:hypothetical protein
MVYNPKTMSLTNFKEQKLRELFASSSELAQLFELLATTSTEKKTRQDAKAAPGADLDKILKAHLQNKQSRVLPVLQARANPEATPKDVYRLILEAQAAFEKVLNDLGPDLSVQLGRNPDMRQAIYDLEYDRMFEIVLEHQGLLRKDRSNPEVASRRNAFDACIQKEGQTVEEYHNELETRLGEMRDVGGEHTDKQAALKMFHGVLPLYGMFKIGIKTEDVNSMAAVRIWAMNWEKNPLVVDNLERKAAEAHALAATSAMLPPKTPTSYVRHEAVPPVHHRGGTPGSMPRGGGRTKGSRFTPVCKLCESNGFPHDHSANSCPRINAMMSDPAILRMFKSLSVTDTSKHAQMAEETRSHVNIIQVERAFAKFGPKNRIILDTGSTQNIYHSTLAGLSVDEQPGQKLTVNTLGGKVTMTKTGRHTDFGPGWIWPEAEFSLLSWGAMDDEGWRMLPSHSRHLQIGKNGKHHDFDRLIGGLYAWRQPSEGHVATAMDSEDDTQDTDGEDVDGGSEDEDNDGDVKRIVQSYHERSGHCSIEPLVALLTTEDIQGLPRQLSATEIRRAWNSLPPCAACLEANMQMLKVRPLPTRVDFPVGYKLHMDLVFYAKLVFLFVREHQTGYAHLAKLQGKDLVQVVDALEQVIDFYKLYGHTVREIACDSEEVFKSARPSMMRHGVELNIRAPGVHEKSAESGVHILRAKTRVLLSDAQHRGVVVPKAVVPHALFYAIRTMNATPNKLTDGRIPYTLVTGKPVYAKDLEKRFADLVIAKVPSKTGDDATTDMRGQYGLVLGHYQDGRGKIKMLVLGSNTKRPVIVDRHLTKVIKKNDRAQALLDRWEGADPKLDDFVETELGEDADDSSSSGVGFGPIHEFNTQADTADTPSNDTDAPAVAPAQHFIVIPPPPSYFPTPPPTPPGGPDPATVPLYRLAPLPPASTTDNSVEATPGVLGPIPTTTTATDADTTTSGVSSQSHPSGRARRSTMGNPNYLKLHEEGRADVATPDRTGVEQEKRAATLKEVGVLLRLNVFHPVNPARIPAEDLQQAIRSMGIKTVKTTADSGKSVVKMRLAARGDQQVLPPGTLTSSPTMSMAAFYTLLAIAAKRGLKLKTFDVVCAYGNSPWEGPPVYMWISAPFASAVVHHRPEWANLILHDGRMLMQVDAGLYGLRESGLLWHKTFTKVLTDKAGLRQTVTEPNVFFRGRDLLTGKHVDDMIMLYKDPEDADELGDIMREAFPEGIKQSDGIVDFLGFRIEPLPGMFLVHQPKQLRKLQELYPLPDSVKFPQRTPARIDLLKNRDESSTQVDQPTYARMIGEVAFLTNSRPDICAVVSFLQSFTHCPTEETMSDLYRLLAYLYTTQDYGLVIAPSLEGNLEVDAAADAGYGTHEDGYSHGGTIVTVGGTPVYWSSKKIKLIANSSTRAEIAQAALALEPLDTVRDLMHDLGFAPPTSRLMQDNQSAITLANDGFGKAARNKAWAIRIANIKEHLLEGAVTLQYQPTEKMAADGLTKCLAPAPFERFRARMNVFDLCVVRKVGQDALTNLGGVLGM